MAGLIDDYLAVLDRRLGFDRALSARVRAEVEDHLREAAEASALPPDEAERRAVCRFGDADEIARRFAADALSAQANRTWLALAAAAGAGFLAMRLRRMMLDGGAFDAAPVAALIDRYAFIAAITAGIAGWLVLHLRPQISRFRLAGAAGTISFALLTTSIAAGALVAIMANRQFELPTLAALLLESAMAVWLAANVLGLQRRAFAAERALKG